MNASHLGVLASFGPAIVLSTAVAAQPVRWDDVLDKEPAWYGWTGIEVILRTQVVADGH